jgi:photosystem II stability/assembly factor-like uncharacterized protein
MKATLTRGRLPGRQAALPLFLLLFALTAFAEEAQDADPSIEVIRSGIPHDALFALEMTGEWGMAIGNYGLMIETNDGGKTWNVLPPKTELALLGIAHVGEHRLIVGQKGFVLARTGDEDWREVDSGLNARLLNVAMGEAGYTIAVGEFGFVARSRDHGATWEPIEVDWGQFNDEGYEPHLYEAVVLGDGAVMIAGEFGLIIRTEDDGQTWTLVAQGDESVFDIDLASDGSNTGYAVGQEGLLMKTADNGRTWERLDPGTTANLLGVWNGQSEVVIVGIRTLLRSSDDGATFTAAEDYAIIRTWYQGVDAGVTETPAGDKGFLRQQHVYIVGHRGSIARVLE